MSRNVTALVTIAAVALLLIGLTAPVAGQSVEVNADNETTATPAETPESERIDANTVLLDSGYNAETGMAWVTIKSERLQEITVTDAGSLIEGGEIPRRSATLKPGETTTIKVPATKVRSFVGVSVATPNTLYGVPLEVGQTSIFTDEASWMTAQTAGAAGFVGGLAAVIALAYYRKRGGRGEVDRIV